MKGQSRCTHHCLESSVSCLQVYKFVPFWKSSPKDCSTWMTIGTGVPNEQIHSSVTIFLISGCMRKVLVCGAICQPASLPGMIWPALHTWEVLVVYMFEELRRKQALSSLTEPSKQSSSSAQRRPSFPPRAFLCPSVLCNVTLSLIQRTHEFPSLLTYLCGELCSFKPCRYIADANISWKLPWLFRLVIVLEDRQACFV